MVSRSDYKKHYYELYDYYNVIKRNNDISDLNNLYSKVKEIIPYYYNKGKISKKYDKLLEIVLKCESFFSDKFIINKKVYVDKNLKISKDSSKEEILDYIVNETRLFLNSFYKYKNINDFSFENMCGYSSFKVVEICNILNLKSDVYQIEPGYLEEANLFDGSNNHYFTIVELGDDIYLIDCTYKQFFKLGKTQLNRLGLIDISTPRVGAFMVMNNERKKLATTLLEKGYIKLTKENIKKYMDGFTISFRNGLYYETTNDFSFETKYNSNNYYEFLHKKDNQVNYEPKKVLGYQKEPLNNNKLDFKLKKF